MKTKSKWLKPTRLIPLVLIAFAILGALAFRISSKSDLAREMAAIRAKGLPTNPKELDAWYAAVPPEENAGLKFLEAYKLFVEAGEGRDPGIVEWREIRHDAALNTMVVAWLATHVAKNEETLKLVHEAAGLERSRYPTDLSKAPDIDFTHLTRVKGLAQLLRWEAVLKAERGDASGAARSLISGFALAHTLAQEPLLISELVRIACLSIQLAGMERVVSVAKFPEADLVELAKITTKAADDCQRTLHRALIGERAFANTGRTLTFDDYEQMFNWGGTPPISPEWPEFARRGFYNLRMGLGIQSRDHAYYLRNVGKLADAAALKSPAMLAESRRVEAEIMAELNDHPFVYLWSGASLPVLMNVAPKEVLLEARLRCALAALDIEIFRARNNGRLPTTNELTPHVSKEVPRDPIDGKPLRFHPNPDGPGYKIIAPAATVDAQSSGLPGRTNDISFTVPR